MRERCKRRTSSVRVEQSSDADVDTIVSETTDHSSLAALAKRFIEIDDALLAMGELDELMPSTQSALLDEQDAIIEAASAIPTRTLLDVAYKLAIWRADAADLEANAISRADSLLLSLSRELLGPATPPCAGHLYNQALACAQPRAGMVVADERGSTLTLPSCH